MKYLLNTIEDINNVFIINPYESKYFEGPTGEDEDLRVFKLLTRNYKFLNSEEAIFNSCKMYDEQSSIIEKDKNYDKIIIDLSDYKQTKPIAILDFRTLDNLLNKSIFKDELNQYIDEAQNKFKEEIDYDVLNADTDFQIKHYLSLYLTDLRRSIDSINSLELNRIQKIVGGSYISSYKETIKYINTKYQDYIPVEEDDNLKKIILHNKTQRFLTIESELINRGFISKFAGKLYWNEQKGYKVKLVKLCRIIQHHGYTNKYIKIGKIISFFEDRYNIDTGDQSKPSKFTGSEKLIEAEFHFLKF